MSSRATTKDTFAVVRRLDDEIASLEKRKLSLEREILDAEQHFLETNDEQVRRMREVMLVSKRREHADLNLEIEKRVAHRTALEKENKIQFVILLVILAAVVIAGLLS